jgi:RNA polymerase sigma-70 factor (sigma-E family)
MGSGMSRDQEFGDYYAARGAAFRATAYLLCGDWHLADDLTQIAFAKLYLAWPRIQRKEPIDRYVRRTLVRVFLDERRRPWRRERPTAAFVDLDPGAPAGTDRVDDRLILRRALAAVPTRQRAVVVLRFWEDLSVEETAELLGISVGTVKSQASRGLETLRRLLGVPDTAFTGKE